MSTPKKLIFILIIHFSLRIIKLSCWKYFMLVNYRRKYDSEQSSNNVCVFQVKFRTLNELPVEYVLENNLLIKKRNKSNNN